ncbi:winged helix-turn-helix domain-containing protein [Nonomuraea monospora]|uniref:Winged helix-turn-helix domain-containing protein n=1 Tax=Nonomuraea monospora TaxID=568818 RepID=A0ABN3CZA9_9ACTN
MARREACKFWLNRAVQSVVKLLGGRMHRIHFTAGDLARVRVAPTLGPMAETLFSLYALRGRAEEAVFGAWRRRVRGRLGPRFAVLGGIVPARLPSFDLALLAGPGGDLEESAETFLAKPAQAVRAELDFYAGHHGRVPAALAGLVDTLAARREVLSTLKAYHHAAVGSHWTRIRGHLDAERAQRGAVLLDRGVDGLLSSLHPSVRWSPPTLYVDAGEQFDDDFVLDGRGLLLVASFFHRMPGVMYELGDRATCILIYPAVVGAEHAAGVWAGGQPEGAGQPARTDPRVRPDRHRGRCEQHRRPGAARGNVLSGHKPAHRGAAPGGSDHHPAAPQPRPAPSHPDRTDAPE